MDALLHDWILLLRDELLCRLHRQDPRPVLERLRTFESEHRDRLEGLFLDRILKPLEPHERLILLHSLLRHNLPDYDRTVDSLLDRPLPDTVSEALHLLFDDAQALEVRSRLIARPLPADLFLVQADGRTTLRDDVAQQALGDTPPAIRPSRAYDLVRPSVGLDEVVLPEDIRRTLLDLIGSWTSKPWSDHPASVRGTVPVLHFTGLPGTGKTLTAEAFAHDLGLPLVKVRLEEHPTLDLERLVQETNTFDCVVLLDDIDKVLQTAPVKRAVSLLSACESTRNILILTSNDLPLKRAFAPLARRITHDLPFPVPSRRLRSRLWLRHLPNGFSFASADDLETLSRMYLLPGGNIKNVLLNHAYQPSPSASVTAADLADFIDKELRKLTHSLEIDLEVITPPTDTDKVDRRLLGSLRDIADLAGADLSRLPDPPKPLRIGLGGEAHVGTVASHLALLLGKPVILDLFFTERPDPERRERFRVFNESLPPGESVRLFVLSSDNLHHTLHIPTLGLTDQAVLLWCLDHPSREDLKLLHYFRRIDHPPGQGSHPDLLTELQASADVDLSALVPADLRTVVLPYLSLHTRLLGQRLTETEVRKVLESVTGPLPACQRPLFGRHSLPPRPVAPTARTDISCHRRRPHDRTPKA